LLGAAGQGALPRPGLIVTALGLPFHAAIWNV